MIHESLIGGNSDLKLKDADCAMRQAEITPVHFAPEKALASVNEISVSAGIRLAVLEISVTPKQARNVNLPLLTIDTLTYTANRNGFAHAKLLESDIDVKSSSYSIILERNLYSFADSWWKSAVCRPSSFWCETYLKNCEGSGGFGFGQQDFHSCRCWGFWRCTIPTPA